MCSNVFPAHGRRLVLHDHVVHGKSDGRKVVQDFPNAAAMLDEG